jgi:hypothetical protein
MQRKSSARSLLLASVVAAGLCAARPAAAMSQQVGVELSCAGSSADGMTIFVNVTSSSVLADRPLAVAVAAERTPPDETRFPELGRPAYVLTSRAPFPRLDARGARSLELSLPRTMVPLPEQLFLQAAVGYRGTVLYSNALPIARHGERFVRAGDLEVARAEHAATRLLDDRVLVTGGLGRDALALASAERFDPRTGLFTSVAPMRRPRWRHGATLLPGDGRVLVTGGLVTAWGPPTAEVEVYDPVLERFSPLASMGLARARHAAVAFIDPATKRPRVLVAGGEGEAAISSEVFDLDGGEFRFAGKLPRERVAGTAVLLEDGTIALAGGVDLSGRPVPVVDRFDPASGKWFSSGSMHLPRTGETIVQAAGGSFFVIGGGYAPPECLECPAQRWHRVERFDPETGEFHFLAAPLLADRIDARAALLDDGVVLVTGGGQTTEVLDPEQGFRTAGCLTPGRGASVTALPGGRALVAGGTRLRREAWVYSRR